MGDGLYSSVCDGVGAVHPGHKVLGMQERWRGGGPQEAESRSRPILTLGDPRITRVNRVYCHGGMGTVASQMQSNTAYGVR